LYGGNSRLIRLKLPEAFCLSDEAIQQRVRVPILGTIWKPWRADLGSDQICELMDGLGRAYASIAKHDVDEQ
jgi:hypothetical protein